MWGGGGGIGTIMVAVCNYLSDGWMQAGEALLDGLWTLASDTEWATASGGNVTGTGTSTSGAGVGADVVAGAVRLLGRCAPTTGLVMRAAGGGAPAAARRAVGRSALAQWADTHPEVEISIVPACECWFCCAEV